MTFYLLPEDKFSLYLEVLSDPLIFSGQGIWD
ncbi:hypothetical protein BC2230_10417 [Burkholderia cepacia]